MKTDDPMQELVRKHAEDLWARVSMLANLDGKSDRQQAEAKKFLEHNLDELIDAIRDDEYDTLSEDPEINHHIGWLQGVADAADVTVTQVLDQSSSRWTIR